jgi:hypothetical protein
VKAGQQRIARPYVVGLVSTVVLGSLTAAGLFAASAADARTQASQQSAQHAVDTLPVPASLSEQGVIDCGQVNIDRCLYSSHTPPDAVHEVVALMARIGTTGTTDCGDGTRPDATRCSFDAAVDGVPVRVMLWPHIASSLQFKGTDVWIDVRTDSDV